MSTARFPTKTAFSLVWFCVFISGVYFTFTYVGASEGEEEQSLSVTDIARTVITAPPEGQTSPLPAVLSPSTPAIQKRPTKTGKVRNSALEHPIEDPTGALEFFYRSLEQTESKQANVITRIIHYGDSMLTGDTISGAARRSLQDRFGNAGHGFILAGKPWRWYMHQGAETWNSSGYKINRITKNPTTDGLFGLGGVVFRTFQPGCRFYVQPTDGQEVSRFELSYLGHKRGGRLRLEVPGREPEIIDTKAPESISRFHSISVEKGAHRLVVRHDGGGETRVFGVALELDGPGVVYDSIGVNGLHSSNFDRYNPQHLSEQIKHRAPALIISMLGTNASQNPRLNLNKYGFHYSAMLDLLRKGHPKASCLVISTPDRVLEQRRGKSLIARIVKQQKEVARQQRCAFWNTYEAMGGKGSAQSWRRRNPPLMGGDLTHLTPEGAEKLGSQIARALVDGYERWSESQTKQRAQNNQGLEENPEAEAGQVPDQRDKRIKSGS